MIMIPPFMCGIEDDNAADGDDHHYKKEDQEEDDATKGAHASAIHPRSSDWKQDKPPAGQTFTPTADTPWPPAEICKDPSDFQE